MFFETVAAEMAAEYRRIYLRSKEDPGTAGDEGESNWAGLLSDWLPSDVYVATKGRILGTNGAASPQVDVVVLSANYPRKLREKKMYLAGGVLAAFECKNTLKRSHLPKFFANAARISRVAGEAVRRGTYFDEAFSPIFYGMLAHGHDLDSSEPEEQIDSAINHLHQRVSHPRELPEVICISNLMTWTKLYSGAEHRNPAPGPLPSTIDVGAVEAGDYCARSSFMRWTRWSYFLDKPNDPQPNPIGELILHILKHLAIAEDDRERMAYYYQGVLAPQEQRGVTTRSWDIRRIYSRHLIHSMGSGHWPVHNNSESKNRANLP